MTDKRIIQSRSTKEDDCWIWDGPTAKGYGRFYHRGKTVSAHRLSYEVFRGKIPKNAVIDHLCRTPLCVNPHHLEPVSVSENTRRGASTKLTMKDIETIRQMYATKAYKQLDLAQLFKVDQANISRIVNRKAWKTA